MKIYLSMPISGHAEASMERASAAKALVEGKGHKAVSPFDACGGSEGDFPSQIGKCVEALVRCDAVFQMSGWSYSKRCAVEWQTAVAFNKKIFTHANQIKDISK